MLNVFVSYYEDASEDYAEQIHKTLTENQFDVYVDHIIRKKEKKETGYIRENIDAAIDKCDIFILLNTVGSLDRDEVIREFKKAFPSLNFSEPKLHIFRDVSVRVPRVTAKFKNETKVDLSKLHQYDFKNVNELTRQILDTITYSQVKNESEPASTLSVPDMRLLRIRKIYLDVFNAYPSQVQELIIEIDTLLEAKNIDYTTIEQKAKLILTLDPSNLYAKNILGIVYATFKKYHNAEDLFSDVISLARNSSIGYNNRAIAKFYQKRYYDALEDMNKAVETDEKDVDFINFKASILFKLQDYDEANDCYDNALSIDKSNFSALVGKAVLLLDENRKEALKLLNKARIINDKDPSLWYNLGVLYSKDEKSEEAIEFFNNAIKYDKGDFLILSLLQMGIAFRKGLQYKEALEAYDKVIDLDPENAEVYFNKGVALGYIQDHGNALSCFEKSLVIDPLNARAVLNKASALANLNRRNDALIELDNWLRINGNDQQALYLKGQILYKSKLFNRAEKIARKLMELDPQNLEYVINLCYTLSEQKKFKEYLKMIKEAITRFPNDERLLANLAYVYLHLHKPKLALDACDKAISRNPSLAVAHYNRACALCLLKDEVQVVSSLKKAIELDSNFIAVARSDVDLIPIKELKDVKKLLGV